MTEAEEVKPYLPEGWAWTNLENCVEILDCQRIPINAKDRETRKGEIPYYGATGQIGWIDDYLFDEELVLLGEDGAPFLDPSKNKSYIISGKSWVNNHAHVLKAINGLTINQFILHYLNIFHYEDYVTGTTRLKLNQAPMKKIPIPLAPLPEQRRIVARIEELFSRLDTGVEALQRAKAQLRRYRQAVLKAAVEGRLTEEWRKAHPEIEPAKNLLKRVNKDVLRTNKEMCKFKSLLSEQFNKEDKVMLPRGWTWATVEQLTRKVTSGSRGWAQFYSDSGSLFIRAQDIKTDELRFDKSAFVRIPSNAEGTRTRVQFGDILIVITGANVTKSALVESDLGEAYVSQHVGLLRPATIDLASYLYTNIVAPKYGRDILRKQAYGAGKPGLNLDNIRNLIIRLPPLAEQGIIVEEVERCKSIADSIEAIIEDSLKRADRLRQSILKRAFEGKLVPQDPSDEPASISLQIIKAERNKKFNIKEEK